MSFIYLTQHQGTSSTFLKLKGLVATEEKPGLKKKVDVSLSSSRVALEAHVMSKCPDARGCLQELIVPAMEKIEDLVDFKLSAIGK